MNPSTRILLFLAFFCGCSYCVWTTPFLRADYSGSRATLSSALDSNGNSHLVYSVRAGFGFEVRYLKLAPAQKVMCSYVFATRGAANPFVATSADGKNVFLAYEDFNALWFTESENGGCVWSKPIKVPTEASAEIYDPVLVYVQETGRLFVFYEKYRQSKFSVAYVSRASASTLFSPEKEFAVPNLNGFTAIYAIAKGVPIIQVFASVFESTSSSKGFLMQFTSESNGVTWTGPRQVAENIDVVMKTTVTTGPKGFIVALYCDVDSWKLVVKYSQDAGKTWSPPFVSQIVLSLLTLEQVQNTIRAVADADGKVLRLFCFASPSDKVHAYSEWKFPEMTEQVLSTPFVHEGNRCNAGIAITAQRAGPKIYVTAFVDYDMGGGAEGRLYSATDVSDIQEISYAQ